MKPSHEKPGVQVHPFGSLCSRVMPKLRDEMLAHVAAEQPRIFGPAAIPEAAKLSLNVAPLRRGTR